MANNISQIICASNTANMGLGNCAPPEAPVDGLIGMPLDQVITETDATDPIALLKAKLVADDHTTRWFFIPVTDVTPNKTEAAMDTSGSGAIFVAKDESVNYDYESKGATNCMQKALTDFDSRNGSFSWLKLQSNDYVKGQASKNPAIPYADEMVGYLPQLVYVPAMDDATYTTVAASHVMMNHLNPRNEQINQAYLNWTVAKLGQSIRPILKLYAVQSILMKQASTLVTTGVLPVLAVNGCGTNFGLTYRTSLTAACFTATNGNTGASLAISSIAINAVTGVITITLTTPPATGVPIIIKLAAVSVLSALGIKYFETPFGVTIVNI